MIGCFDHSYWLALACVAFEWKPVLRNVFACVILLRLLRFLRTFLTQSIALRALRLGGNRALLFASLRAFNFTVVMFRYHFFISIRHPRDIE